MDVLREPFFIIIIPIFTTGLGAFLIGYLMAKGSIWRRKTPAPAWFDRATVVFAFALIAIGLLYTGWTTA